MLYERASGTRCGLCNTLNPSTSPGILIDRPVHALLFVYICRGLQELERTGWKRSSLPLEPEPKGEHDKKYDGKYHGQCVLIIFSIEDAPRSHVPPSLCAK